ncbi:hypothetical protein [Planktothrix agardhii]|uniref:hypothetical protein n=1 Tax=Planktothrix agardhii TaxID=1160 RepID=UPI0011D23DEF|nr:hypothetical protein [Planktothrix agardhii]
MGSVARSIIYKSVLANYTALRLPKLADQQNEIPSTPQHPPGAGLFFGQRRNTQNRHRRQGRTNSRDGLHYNLRTEFW